MGNGIPAGNGALWGMGMGSNIPPWRRTGAGTKSKSGGRGWEQGGIPRPRSTPLTSLDIRTLIAKVWSMEVNGSHMYILAQKLKCCRHRLVQWQ
ncbi:uncharacterized protein DS421_9g285700 [Arachis hypogaea]|nr:uncharacterized protein DS421_9g285700 [Arachis hypogaea]